MKISVHRNKGLLAAALTLFAFAAGAAVPSDEAKSVAFTLLLTDQRTATVHYDGSVEIRDGNGAVIAVKHLSPEYDPLLIAHSTAADQRNMAEDLSRTPPALTDAYAANQVVVVFSDAAVPSADAVERVAAGAHTVMSPDAGAESALVAVGVIEAERLYGSIDRGALARLATRGGSGINFANAFRLQLDGTTAVRDAVAALKKQAGIVYASPAWHVAPMLAERHPKMRATMSAQTSVAAAVARPNGVSPNLPTNYALISSEQSLLDAPGVDAAAAYDEIWSRFQQIPGEGEIITNVSVGDINDGTNPQCAAFAPTVATIEGQHYLDWPAMPLIPVYVSDVQGNLSGAANVCGIDPQLGEVGLDFSVMAPLPDNLQRPGRQPRGPDQAFDLLGIAPGAQYRLVVPDADTYADIQTALLAAARQTPTPTVITASLGYGFDTEGFPGRYLEDDPLTEAIVASIIENYGITVVIAANDGTRTYTNAAIGPGGGSIQTNLVAGGETPTDLADVELSTTPSLLFDSGAIAAGGTTLNDIFAVPPQYATGADAKLQQPYAETRWTGSLNYSSGVGTRVNLSAPGDNILAMYVAGPDQIGLASEGGTSASAPEIAAAAAVARQLARLTGHPFANARAVRDYLVQQGTPVASVPQADPLPIGPQVNLRKIVEGLLQDAQGTPAVARVAISQRRMSYSFYFSLDTATDPSAIDLQGPDFEGLGLPSGANAFAWITIAPDWEFMPTGTQYALTVLLGPADTIFTDGFEGSSAGQTLATTASARIQPADIFAAAGLPLAADTARTVRLLYSAQTPDGGRVDKLLALTFSANDGTSNWAQAPNVPAVVDGPTITVSYDLTHLRQTPAPIGGDPLIVHPTLVVSSPGRVGPAASTWWHHTYEVPLNGLQGTVEVPVSALQGAGVYGVGIWTSYLDLGYAKLWFLGDFAITRVLPAAGGSAAPPAPLLSYAGSLPGHRLELPLHAADPVQIAYDVSAIAGADGAMLEVSASGPVDGYQLPMYQLFNNPGGSVRDDNGHDHGSLAWIPLQGSAGTVALTPAQLKLNPGMPSDVRVVATQGGSPIGSAGASSFIQPLGLAPPSGDRSPEFGADAQGTHGYLLNYDPIAGEAFYSFDPTTDAVTAGPFRWSGTAGNPPPPSAYYHTYGNPPLADGKVLTVLGYPDGSSAPLLLDIASGAFTPLAANTITAYFNAATDPTGALAVVVGAHADGLALFSLNADSGSVSAPYDLDTIVPGVVLNTGSPIALNTQTKIAMTAVTADFSSSTPWTLVTLDTTTGALDDFPNLGVGTVPAQGIAIDSTTNKAAVGSADGTLSIFDLATRQGRSYPTNNIVMAVAADEIHHLFVVAVQQSNALEINQDQVESQIGDPDNNAISQILVYDEDGNEIESFENFTLQFPIPGGETLLKLVPGLRKGYVQTGPAPDFPVPFDY